MSHALGEVFTLEGNRIGYYEYNGTCDYVTTRIQATEDQVRLTWRGDNIRYCKDPSHVHSLCIIYSAYGKGFYWLGKWCSICWCITAGFDPHNDIPGRLFG